MNNNFLKKIFATLSLLLILLGFSGYAAAVEIDRSLQSIPASDFRIHIPTDADDAFANIDIEALRIEAATDSLAQRLRNHAAQFLGTRYVWGATGPKSFDCSGFIGYVFRKEGITLPRTSSMQYRHGERVENRKWEVGDLLFFSSARSGKGRVGHVGMVAEVNPDGSCTFIHASTKRGVVYQKFPDGGYYSRNFVGAKRVIDVDDIS